MLTRIQVFLKRTKLDRLINGETIRYAFWGVVTTAINIGLFRLLYHFHMEYTTANLIAIITAKVAAFFANKFFVFRSQNENWKELLLEVFRYLYTRGFTLLVDYFGLILLVDVLGGNAKYMKYVTTALVVMINYLFGKFLVFKKKKQPLKEETL